MPAASLSVVEQAVTSMIESVAAGRVLPVYAMNFHNDGTALPSFLKDVPYHIDPAVNPALTVSPGINVPSYYLSGGLSFSEMHPEDGYLDSINAVHWGEAGAEKIWIFVNPAFSYVLCNEDVSSWEPKCPYPVNHKKIMISPAFLRAQGMPYQLVCQRPGTVIYVREAVYHQVINTGLLLAEAVNVGGPSWNGVLAQIYCKCPDTATDIIPRNRRFGDRTTSRPVSFHERSTEACVSVASTVGAAQAHARRHVPGKGTDVFSCRLCPTVYVTLTGLQRHYSSGHPRDNVTIGYTLCPACNKLISTNHFRRHEASCRVGDSSCEKCRQSFSSRQIQRHRRACLYPEPT